MSSPRRDWISVLSKAEPSTLARTFAALGPEPAHTWLRPPEIGTVMVQGRQGAEGAAFNLGEMTVTRCTLRLDDGTVGHAYVPGRDTDHARQAAICDALLQGPRAGDVEQAVIAPLRTVHAGVHRDIAAKAAATKVDFFTMVRGEG